MLSQLVARAELRKIDRAAKSAAARAVARKILGRIVPPAELPDLCFPRLDGAGPVVTVYAVALYFDPCEGAGVSPFMTLRQFVRAGDRPLTDSEAALVAVSAELTNWKATRPPMEKYARPCPIVCYRVVPVPAAVPSVSAPKYGA